MTTNPITMDWSRRGLLGLAGGLGACALLPALATAQHYPGDPTQRP